MKTKFDIRVLFENKMKVQKNKETMLSALSRFGKLYVVADSVLLVFKRHLNRKTIEKCSSDCNEYIHIQ